MPDGDSAPEVIGPVGPSAPPTAAAGPEVIGPVGPSAPPEDGTDLAVPEMSPEPSPEPSPEAEDGPPASPEAGAAEGAPEKKAKKEKKVKEAKEPKPVLVKDKTMGKLQHEDLDWIWIGDMEDARNKKALQDNNVRYILNCTPERANGGVNNFFEKDSYFSYCRVALGDNATEQLKVRLEASWDFLERVRVREDGGVLVHCQQGVSRSVSMVLSYLMKYYRMSFDDALALAKKSRKQACPNEGFEAQLRAFEEDLRRTNGYEKIPPKRKQAVDRGIGVGTARGPSVAPGVGPAGPAPGPVKGPAGPPRGPAVGPSVGPARGPAVGPAPPPAGPSVEKRKAVAGPQVGPARPTAGPAVGPAVGPTKPPKKAKIDMA